MNRGRFASITSSLLVRKGEARPWQMPGTETPDLRTQRDQPRQRQVSEEERQIEADYQSWKRAHDAEIATRPNGHVHGHGHSHGNGHAHGHGNGYAGHAEESDEHTRRCTLRLTPAEYERLGIIAVKRDLTRQQLLRQAIDHYLAAAKVEYKSACGCLSGDGCKGEC